MVTNSGRFGRFGTDLQIDQILDADRFDSELDRKPENNRTFQPPESGNQREEQDMFVFFGFVNLKSLISGSAASEPPSPGKPLLAPILISFLSLVNNRFCFYLCRVPADDEPAVQFHASRNWRRDRSFGAFFGRREAGTSLALVEQNITVGTETDRRRNRTKTGLKSIHTL